jgi:predicted nucleic acid-binding protein
VDRLFLDANVLFSAAYRIDSALLRLWKFDDVELVTSAYAFEEARRNLDTGPQRHRLQELLTGINMVPESDFSLPDGLVLAEKDVPILRAAFAAKASHLITGDRKDFGRYFERKLGNVAVMTPRAYIETRKSDSERARPHRSRSPRRPRK